MAPFTIGGDWVPGQQESKSPKKIVVRVEKRKGRILTVIKNVNIGPEELKELLKALKAECHCGGTLSGDALELQGNHEEKVKKILKQKNLL